MQAPRTARPVVRRPLVWSPAITSFRAAHHRSDAHRSRPGAAGLAMPGAWLGSWQDGGHDGERAERAFLAYETLRHVAAFSVVCAPAAFGSGLLDGLLPGHGLLAGHQVAIRLLAALLAALACAVLGGWPAELIGQGRRLVQVRLALFTLAILLLALYATVAIEAHPDAGSGAEFLVMMAAAIPLAPWPAAAVPFVAVAGYGAFRTLPQPGLALWLLAAAIAAILVIGSRFRSRVRLNVRLRTQRERIETLLVDYEHGSSELRWAAGADGMLRIEATQPRSHPGAARLASAAASGSPLAVNWAEFVRTGCRPGAPARASFLVLRDAIRREQPFRDCVLPVPVGEEEQWWAFSGRPVLAASGDVCGYRGIASDVTEQRAAERRVRYLAAHDGLTGLGNRASFLATLGDRLAGRTAVELILVNIDGFQLVNDTHGAEIGDALLAAVAARLRTLAGPAAVLARLGGDEFGILLPCADPHDAAAPTLARRLPAALGEPFPVAGLALHIGASLGVAASPAHGRDGTALFKAASLALARAKALGGSIAVRYDRGLEAAQSDRKALQLDLRSAMARGEFEVEYQPIVELATGRTIACEALLRWNHPQRGRVSPALFIEIAEQIGLIAALGAWVVRTAVRDAAGWPGDVAVTVNVSPLQFRSALLIEAVTQALELTGFEPARLMLEVTESTVLDASADTTAVLTSLRGAGVSLALDDFGTGYASLAYLDRFQFDALKVDRSFLENSHRPATGAILEAVARLGTDLGMRTVAEGVETEAQRARLVELGYNCGQGFLFARSMPASAILARLAPATYAAPRTLGATPAAV